MESVAQNSGLALSFTESPMFINPLSSDDSAIPSPTQASDGVENLPEPLEIGLWTQPTLKLRGGFRYLTVFSTSPYAVSISNISNVSCAISFAPHVSDLRDYSGYFFASDPVLYDKDFLNKVCSDLRIAQFVHISCCIDLVCRSVYSSDQYGTSPYRETFALGTSTR